MKVPENRAVTRAAVAALFPETWTHADNVDWLRVAYQLKLLGVWPAGVKLSQVLAACETLGVLQRQGQYLLRRNPNPPALPALPRDSTT